MKNPQEILDLRIYPLIEILEKTSFQRRDSDTPCGNFKDKNQDSWKLCS